MELLATEYEFQLTTKGKTWDLKITLLNSKKMINVKKYCGLEGEEVLRKIDEVNNYLTKSINKNNQARELKDVILSSEMFFEIKKILG